MARATAWGLVAAVGRAGGASRPGPAASGASPSKPAGEGAVGNGDAWMDGPTLDYSPRVGVVPKAYVAPLATVPPLARAVRLPGASRPPNTRTAAALYRRSGRPT